ncbi:flavodoxin family protein [Arthrobacter silvisoli]|uniref:flavodoxin family protein n=1 Tax=Arthrobacter silvisoli TaxID=2291022 RepID=UPI000E210286|nr:flavodoxin domain-containing protein [Arthrobacter silvisoli]
MKALILYDSAYGNTKSIAESLASSLQPLDAAAISVKDFRPGDLSAYDLLVVGSPIQGWRPTPKITELLSGLAGDGLKGVKAAAFDTRVKLFVHGDAARKMTTALRQAGADIISKPMAFYVKGAEGPLLNGETGRAATWARQLLAAFNGDPTSENH